MQGDARQRFNRAVVHRDVFQCQHKEVWSLESGVWSLKSFLLTPDFRLQTPDF
jgi:hypothetical protein